MFHPGSNQHIRINFVDILTRRYLLRCFTAQQLFQNGDQASLDLIDDLCIRDFECYPDYLPSEFKGTEYLKAKEDLDLELE